MKLSENGQNLIKEFEGLKLKAYRCSSNKLTIGYGHTGKEVFEGMTITKEEADIFFKYDIVRFENAVKRLVKVPLNQNQFDALVSFTFNCGEDAKGLGGSTLLKLLNAGDYTGAAEQFKRWVYSGNVVSLGLQKRRKIEKELFLTAV